MGLSEIQSILTQVGEYFSKAGGSAANTTRGLAGFGISTQLLGVRGFDEVGGRGVLLLEARQLAAGVCCCALVPPRAAL